MKLTELDPRWVGAGGEGVSDKDGNPVPARHGVGLSFLCPCGPCTAKRTDDPDENFYLRCFVEFKNPLDGGPPHDGRVTWQRTGDTFETLTLTPSILRSKEKGGCGWHGFITNGEIITV